ncbi:MAG: right-handed parallel beta-helix repeat-containing protein [Methanobacteriaceae archaeon]|nr:right-handed parallel beta-helix repeat-containing protein [Methanobacteriaceae archaeon]
MIISIIGTVSAANLTVSPGGSIQAAVNNASSGDIIIVSDNNGSAYTYTENVIINKKVQLQAKVGGNITIQALNSSKSVFTINSDGSGSTIQGFIIKTTNNAYSISLTNANNCNIINNTFNNNYGAISLSGSNNRIIGNTLNNNTLGIYDLRGSNHIIQNNTIIGNQYGIQSFYSSNHIIQYNNLTSNNYGIYLAYGSNHLIQNNNLTSNNYGIYLAYGSNHLIQNNNLTSNNYGIYLAYGSNHYITGNNLIDSTTSMCLVFANTAIINNNITGSQYGIKLIYCSNITINKNSIFKNNYGIYILNSTVNCKFNNFSENSQFGLYSWGNGIVNATNNWWGSNNPIISAVTNSDIYATAGNVTYNPWLVMNVNASPGVVGNGNSNITVDLTHNNNGEDVSSQGTLPDNIPVNFTTTLGTVTSPVYTLNGKAISTFTRGTATSGTAYISVSLNKQTIQTNITIDTISPSVNASLASGIYNTTKSVTLTVSDNLDLNPIIYYTINGNTPTTSSTRYTSPIMIITPGTTTLKFMAVDSAGNQAMVQTQNYTLNLVSNININKTYSRIQDAINDPLTLNGHTIEISGNFTENIIIHKKVTIKPVSGANVTIFALNQTEPIFTIISSGNGSCIQDLTIIGAGTSANAKCINIMSANNCSIIGNVIIGNYYGISLYASNNTLIQNNTINNSLYSAIDITSSSNNKVNFNQFFNGVIGVNIVNSNDNQVLTNYLRGIQFCAIYLSTSSRNIFAKNIILENTVGIYAYNSMNNTILYNNISSNRAYGIYFSGMNLGSANNIFIGNCISNNCGDGMQFSGSYNNSIFENDISSNRNRGIYLSSSSANLNLNRITGNNVHGLETSDNCTINATNNWWGTNEPLVSSASGSAIYTAGGTVLYDPWLVINLTGSVVHVTHQNTSNSEITADLTHNNRGENTSGSGSIPDGLPVNFTTTLGSITPTATTKKGKATVILTSSPYSGATTVTATMDNQQVSKAFRKSFSTIQSAISNSLTVNGDVILVESGTYVENVVVNKNLTIFSEGNVTVRASNPSQPVFKINSSGSGTLIQGFIISGAVNSFGLLLNGCSNCTINSNTITNNFFGILTNAVKTMNNVIMNSNITSNQMIGLATCNADNYVIYGNTITYNGYGGMELLDSKNNILHTNLIMSNDGPGIFISNLNNTLIQNNLIPGNVYGVYMEYCGNCTVYGNLIVQGIYGIYTNSSSADINFNRIASNSQYELISENGNVNATNNWWGSNTNPVNLGEIVYNGYVDYNPWLILSIDPSSTVNSGGNASIIADLTHNNLGQDTSSLGHVIKGISITFGTNYGTITSSALTFNGKAAAILNLGTTASRTVTVNATLDSQTVSRQMTITPGSAVLNITSSALNITTLQPISLTYTVPLSSSVTWLSVLWKNTYVFYGELQILVNGTVVKSIGYVNPGYNTWKNSGYRDDVFRAILYANNYILQDGIKPNAIPASFWNDLSSLYGLTSTELQFIQNHRLEFIDNITLKLTYPGADAPNITVTDPLTNSTINLNFTGNTAIRTSPIMYLDGFLAGYEGVKSFAIATTKVNDDILAYWLNQNSTYPVGAMKAAYGTFLTALLMEYCHDQVADVVAREFNITWTRTHPIAVSVGDDAYQTYLTLECDHSMGTTVAGSLKNTILFNYICSSSISPIEYALMNNLGLNQIITINSSVSSVLIDLIHDLGNNIPLEMFIQKGYIIIKSVGNNSNFMVVDPETGIVRDINTVYNYYGAYCFHDQLTSQSYQVGENFQEKEVYLNINYVSKLFGSVVKVFTGVEAIKFSILLLGVAPPLGTIAGVGGIVVGSIQIGRGFYQLYDAAVNTPWTTSRNYEEQLNEDWHEWFINGGPW